GESVEGCGFMILRIRFIDLLHRVGISFRAIGMLQVLRSVKRRRGCEISLLALGCVPGKFLSDLNLGAPAGEDLFVWMVPELMPEAHRDSPMSHRAVWIVLCDV